MLVTHILDQQTLNLFNFLLPTGGNRPLATDIFELTLRGDYEKADLLPLFLDRKDHPYMKEQE